MCNCVQKEEDEEEDKEYDTKMVILCTSEFSRGVLKVNMRALGTL